ncbi:MAG TPA: outer membrane protein assembly factor BamE [Hypericibacter adhaerens]|jgi:outer membrane protein assembly factor BamE (lipoprotein component of BamABCDE complex)|uniref:Outer membrane protein assembly factor BamE n=1 Tax=Hypericibacter adhaerens TaxID=2602016 RepID=A0A5J6N292_9PROT|nr:outer membrane protein assembly factor BamE [Hypericibacter adhaerens]QEX22710.1 outer membrane protein assembly factor BamE [Hypericibacter adhaerens]HWA42890.1 outer membrane protein assembly factor BamE [Hypericibacter adhaerens]
MGRRRRVALSVASFAVAALTAGCSPTIDTRGNLPDADNVLKIQPGIDTKNEVAQLLGSPSTTGTFNDNKWYYISTRTRSVAFLEPEIEDQQVLIVSFDKTGVVDDLKVLGLEDAKQIEPNERVTPTLGRELTIIQQLLGNLGRFNKDAEESGP